MCESVRHFVCLALPALLLGLGSVPVEAGMVRPGGELKPGRGQHGADLRLLRTFYAAPKSDLESNHTFDLWETNGLTSFVRAHGLTNNHALIIDSHGTDYFTWGGTQYVFKPNTRLLPAKAEVPIYSIRDFARVMGPAAAASIHNIVIAGCNQEGALKVSEFRRHFVNATNVTYMAAGHLAYKPSFYQALTRHSDDIEPLYGHQLSGTDGVARMEISRRPAPDSVQLGDYVAELFRPGEAAPYRRQRAGRELLDPGFRSARPALPLGLVRPAAR